MKSYYRIILGSGNIYAEEAHVGNFIGAGWFGEIDLTNKFPENWRDFNKEMIPVYLKEYPDKSKIAAGLACGMLWTIARGINIDDIVLCPDGKGNYFIGEIVSEYKYYKGANLPHRRAVRWFLGVIEKTQMSQPLQNAVSSIGTSSNVTRFTEEIENLIIGKVPPSIIATDETIEDPLEFVMEKHLEDFLVKNWHYTEFGKKYDIFEENGELSGQQYPSDTGPIDILAISKDKKELLVVELKRGRISDVVVGQIQRYMGYVKDVLAEKNQNVRGVIIAFDNDINLTRALSVTQNIDFYTYKIHFELKRK